MQRNRRIEEMGYMRPRKQRKLLPGSLNSTSVGADIDGDRLAFLLAIDRYKRENQRPYPSWPEVLAVAISIGYRKVQYES